MQNKKISLVLLGIGIWLVAAPLTFAYSDEIMAINDILSGLILVILSLFSSIHFFRVYIPLFLILGLWLSFSPLLFWALQPQAYMNDTVVGFVILVLTFRFSGMQGRAEDNPHGAPLGWSLNPSSWWPRGATIFIALICWFLARYLTSYQLGYTKSVWDPFFQNGSLQVLTSSIARIIPISNAGLGSLCYSLILLLGVQGNAQRWRSMPWGVILYGLLVIPTGLLSIFLIILQPVLIDAWCGICLIIAFLMLVMIMISITEVVATLHLLWRYKKNPLLLMDVLWRGAPSTCSIISKSKSWGITVSLKQLVVLALGVFTTITPYIFGTKDAPSVVNFISGPLLITFSAISMAEVARSVRLVNILISLFLLVTPWALKEAQMSLIITDSLVSIAVILLTLCKEPVKHKFGGLTKYLI